MADNYTIGNTDHTSSMTSIMKTEARPTFSEVLLEVLFFLALNLVPLLKWSGALILAAVNAIARICANVKRSFDMKPFRLLDLPPELRNIVYEHHFDLYETPEYREPNFYQGFFQDIFQVIYQEIIPDIFRKKAMRPNAILSASRQIYIEASHVLYSEWDLKLNVTGLRKLDRESIALMAPIHVLRHTNTVTLVIHMPRSDPPGSSGNCGMGEHCLKQLKANVEMVSTALAEMPNLRTLSIDCSVRRGSKLLTVPVVRKRLMTPVHICLSCDC